MAFYYQRLRKLKSPTRLLRTSMLSPVTTMAKRITYLAPGSHQLELADVDEQQSVWRCSGGQQPG